MELPLVVGITGASGAVYGIRMLEVLRQGGIPAHLIISRSAAQTLSEEIDMPVDKARALADVVYPNSDLGAAVSSGSFKTRGMIVIPCSIRTLSDIAYGDTDTLVSRAADVTLKERRRLVLLVRETPFNLAHLRNMTAVTEMGGVIFPPLPAFYNQPASIDEMVDHTVARVLDLFALGPALSPAWPGLRGTDD